MSKNGGVLKEAFAQAAALKAEKWAKDRETALKEWPGVSMKVLAERLGRDHSTIRGCVKEGKK